MTPRELAETIIWKCNGHSRAGDSTTTDLFLDSLESFLAAALEEARQGVLNEQKCKDCGCSYERCCCNPIREMEAKSAAYEECKKAMREAVDDFSRLDFKKNE